MPEVYPVYLFGNKSGGKFNKIADLFQFYLILVEKKLYTQLNTFKTYIFYDKESKIIGIITKLRWLTKWWRIFYEYIYVEEMRVKICVVVVTDSTIIKPFVIIFFEYSSLSLSLSFYPQFLSKKQTVLHLLTLFILPFTRLLTGTRRSDELITW